MHPILARIAFGFLTFSGIAHFLADVVSQYLRYKRTPGPETTLYYGLHTAFSLGQTSFGLLAFLLALRHPALLADRLIPIVALAAAAGWLYVTIEFMTFWQPKLNAAIVVLLLLAAAAFFRSGVPLPTPA